MRKIELRVGPLPFRHWTTTLVLRILYRVVSRTIARAHSFETISVARDVERSEIDIGTEMLTNWNMDPGVPNTPPISWSPSSGSAEVPVVSDNCAQGRCVVSPEGERVFMDHAHLDKAVAISSLAAAMVNKNIPADVLRRACKKATCACLVRERA
jgi:hypothetical protein